DTAALGLVSNPSPQLLSQVLDSRARADPTDPRGRLVRAAEAAGDFSPHPVWRAWFAAAHRDFCATVSTPAATTGTSTAPDPLRPPATSSPSVQKRALPRIVKRRKK